MSSTHLSIAISVLLIAWNGGSSTFAADEAPDFSAVYRILDERCIECHATGDFEGGLVLESHATLLKGGESGLAIVPRKSGESLLIRYVRGEVEKDGKRKFMPPGKRDKLSPEEVQLIARWIDAGAEPPVAGASRPRALNVPKVALRKTPRNAVTALAGSSSGALFAVGRYGTIELRDGETHALVRELTGHKGNVNALAFAPDGARLFAASGENGLTGEIKIWSVSDGALLQTIEGHRDTLYALVLSPNGMILASGSYDQQIKLWNAQTGAELKTLRGHNGAVFSLAFRPDGKLLASASADRTVKLWDVATGQRRDTLSQPTKEQMRVAWSSDGKRLAAAGFDNRIRVWEVSEEGKETTNPLLLAKFAHEQPILQLIWSGDGKTLASGAQDGSVKVWDAVELKERAVLEKQPDWPSGLVFLDAAKLVVGRLDGTFAKYDAATGKGTASDAEIKAAGADRGSQAVAVGAAVGEGAPKSKGTAKAKPKAPVINTLHPRGIQRGHDVEVTVAGTDLDALTIVKFTDPRLRGEIVAIKSPNEATLNVGAPGDLERGSYEFVVGREGGEMSRAARIFVDDLPQLDAGGNARTTLETLPVSVWGVINKPGASARFDFDGQSGQTLVFDLASKGVGSKADAVLSITDADGHVLATNNDFDSTGDPLLAHTFAETGRYTAVVSDSQFGGSAEHFYRLSAGELPFVTACFPLSIPMNAESEVELIGYHLPAMRKVKVKAGRAGELAVPVDPQLRSRRTFTVVVSELAHHALEIEPNNTPREATPIQVPGSAGGGFAPPVDGARHVALVPDAAPAGGLTNQIDQRRVPQLPATSPLAPVVPAVRANSLTAGADLDLFRFEARKGTTWVIETEAAQRGSPTDTKIEVLDAHGKPVERLLLQAVRDSAITFRPIDSATNDARVDNWREMELNELMFIGGEVAKIFRMPEGPDSGFQFYSMNGKRQAYFNTTPTAHALDEPCYIVEPHPPGTRLISNGLPVFPLYYANDDDGDRQLGTDSRLLFSAPADGSYLVAVSDSRGLAGDRYVYRLIVRAAKRDFAIRAAFASQTINAASGQGFTINADRRDGFDGDIDVEITGVPGGFIVSTPLRIEAGHQAGQGSFFALPGAKTPTEAEWTKLQIVASATIDGAKVVRAAQLPAMIKVGGAPQVYVALEPAAPGDTLERLSKPTAFREPTGNELLEITIAPGEIVPAWIKVRRNGHAAELRFDVENLPHGVIVDNLGLNGITLLQGQNEGEIALKAAPWVAETDRLCYAVTREVGKQTSLPVMLHVRKKPAVRAVEVR